MKRLKNEVHINTQQDTQNVRILEIDNFFSNLVETITPDDFEIF